jgi:periplasmic mercuric ion binding protein
MIEVGHYVLSLEKLMKKLLILPLLTLPFLSLFSFSASAKPQTVTLEVPTMNCVTCPFTVKKALQNVEGVSTAEVTYETKLAVVTFDDEKTSVDVLTQATTNAGYPSVEK